MRRHQFSLAKTFILRTTFCVTACLWGLEISAAPRIGVNFTASRLSDFGVNPPDTMGGVGPAHLVELINGGFAVFDKVNGAELGSKSLNAFWTQAGAAPTSFAFDPRIIYDPTVERWFAVSVDNMAGANDILVAVSQTANPLDPWLGFKVRSDPNDHAQWADFPTLGVDSQGVYIAANMLNVGTSQFNSSSLLVIPKSDLITDAPTVDNATLIQNRQDVGVALQSVVDFSSAGGTGVPILSATDLVPSPGFLFTGLQGPVTSPQLETASLISTEVNFRPPGAPQPTIGGAAKAPIFAGNDRFSGNVVRIGDRVWSVQAIENDGRAAARWFEVAATSGDVIQSGVISSPELSFYYPSIAVNELGDAVIGFSGSSAAQPVSSYAVVGHTVGGVTTFGDPLLLKEGVDDYERLDSRGRNRWGDYSATVVDPGDPRSFWDVSAIRVGR